MSTPSPLRLKKREDTRLQMGHLWIYSNEIDVAQTPLKNFQSGQMVTIERYDGRSLGLGYINPHTLLCARLLTYDVALTFDHIEIARRIQRALALRTAFFPKPFYRLVYAESDALPGLIVDRYGDTLVVQITTAGMELLQSQIIQALKQVVNPQAILLRNDHGMRAVEGLPEYVLEAYGQVPPTVTLEENGVAFTISPWTGQKTGWFYDHRENRAQLPRYVSGKRVLDLFSYVGGWGIQAAVNGATEVCCIDSSAPALEMLQTNCALNNVADRVQTRQGDVFGQLKALIDSAEKYDVIIIDPPAFIKKRKDIAAGLIAYQRVNELAMRLLRPEGFLISASCSQHFTKEQLTQAVQAAGMKHKRRVQIVAQGHQAADHPVHPAIPETDYLKALFCRVS
jgi:23S rRNA (cytosine1962-C5)-methyltransferase